MTPVAMKTYNICIQKMYVLVQTPLATQVLLGECLYS